jgi:CheY-like chemotaxis protein
MKIAIIDDSLFMRGLIRNAFLQAMPGAEITEFVDGAQAWEQLPALAPDLVTLDMLMPRMGGLELLAHLRSLPAPPRVIVITANIQQTVRQRCADLGVDDFIAKPITFEKLTAALAPLGTV